MFTAADLIDVMAARSRRRHPLQLDRPFGEFPPTWRAWFQAITPNPEGVRGARPDEFATVMAARPLRERPRRTPVLTRAVAFRQLWRQQWDPAEPSQRGMRRISAAASLFLHVCFTLLLLYVGYVEIGNAPPQAAVQGEAIRVEFIGRGTPVEQGGAPSEGDRGAPSAAAPGASARAAAAPAAAATAAPSDAVSPSPANDAVLAAPPPTTATAPEPTPEVQPPTPTPPTPSQPVQVTQSDDDTAEFTLPPTTPRTTALPTLPVPDVPPPVATREIELVDRPAVRVRDARMPEVPRPAEPTPPGPLRDVELVDRTVPPVRVRDTTLPTLPPVRAPEPLRPRGEVALREPRPAATPTPSAPSRPAGTPTPSPAQGDARTPSPAATGAANAGNAPRGTAGNAPAGTASGTAPSATGRSASAPPAPSNGGRPAGSGSAPQGRAPSGVGMGPSPRPGALPSPNRGDDWGASNQNRPGNAPTGGRTGNLFNPDGSVRLPGNSGNVGGGLPPGTLIEDFEKIDRMGTWLKRPPLDYTPTRFDRFWIPNESLLEEWVRRGVKTVAVPLPGTSKRLRCVVSLLQAGGGCFIDDPNMRDEEATARPPPDVPYKPELQQP